MRHFPLLACLVLLACAPTVPEDTGIVTADRPAPGPSEGGGGGGLADIELCDAGDYRPLVGSPVAATTFPTGPMLRVFGFNDIVTQDYIPQRTNIVYDGGGTITRVYCG